MVQTKVFHILLGVFMREMALIYHTTTSVSTTEVVVRANKGVVVQKS